MSSEAVAQSVSCNTCAQAGLRTEPAHHPLDSLVRERLLPGLSEEQPTFRPVAQEVAPQTLEQSPRQHDIAILGTLALPYTDLHLVTVDIFDLEMSQLFQT